MRPAPVLLSELKPQALRVITLRAAKRHVPALRINNVRRAVNRQPDYRPVTRRAETSENLNFFRIFSKSRDLVDFRKDLQNGISLFTRISNVGTPLKN